MPAMSRLADVGAAITPRNRAAFLACTRGLNRSVSPKNRSKFPPPRNCRDTDAIPMWEFGGFNPDHEPVSNGSHRAAPQKLASTLLGEAPTLVQRQPCAFQRAKSQRCHCFTAPRSARLDNRYACARRTTPPYAQTEKSRKPWLKHRIKAKKSAFAQHQIGRQPA